MLVTIRIIGIKNHRCPGATTRRAHQAFAIGVNGSTDMVITKSSINLSRAGGGMIENPANQMQAIARLR